MQPAPGHDGRLRERALGLAAREIVLPERCGRERESVARGRVGRVEVQRARERGARLGRT